MADLFNVFLTYSVSNIILEPKLVTTKEPALATFCPS